MLFYLILAFTIHGKRQKNNKRKILVLTWNE